MTIEAGAFNVTTGIHRGREHVFVTHANSGKQWVEKFPYDGRDLSDTAALIACGTTKFYLTGTDERSGRPRLTCDTRFWEPVYAPAA